MAIPTVTLNELTEGIDKFIDPAKKVLIGILNDYMDLQYAATTPYTTGKTVIPIETTIEDVNAAANQGIDKKYADIMTIISETHKSGDLRPRSKNGENGNFWDPKLTPVLVVVRPNP